jgi:hypothetical protein
VTEAPEMPQKKGKNRKLSDISSVPEKLFGARMLIEEAKNAEIACRSPDANSKYNTLGSTEARQSLNPAGKIKDDCGHKLAYSQSPEKKIQS